MRATVMVGLIALVGCGDKDAGDTSVVPADRVPLVLALTGEPANGATLYAFCATCHGQNGEGLDGSGFQPLAPVADDDVFVTTVLEGIEGTSMLSYAEEYSDQEIADILAHVHTLSGVAAIAE